MFSTKRSDTVDLMEHEVEQSSSSAVSDEASDRTSRSPDNKHLLHSGPDLRAVLVHPELGITGDVVGKRSDSVGLARSIRTPADVEVGLAPPDYISEAQILFSEKSIRMNFLKKVYSILIVQLLATFGLVCLGVYEKNVQLFVQSNPIVLAVSIGLSFVMIIVIACVPKLRRKTPWNYIFLSMITLFFGYLVMCLASLFDPTYVMLTVGMTLIITLSLTLLAFQPWIDFTNMIGFLCCFCISFLLFGYLMLLSPLQMEVAHTAYLCCGVLLYGFFIVYDTQLMIGGRHKYTISPEEYVFAALNLYLDIIYMFIYLLRLGRK